MKKFIVLMALVAMIGVAQAELFINGDFEAGAWSGGGSGSGSTTWWTPWWSSFPPIYQQDSGGSDGGDWMQFDTSGAWQLPGQWGWAWSGIWSNTVPTVSGTEMTLSGMAKHITAGNTLRAFVQFMDAGGNRLDYDGDGDIDNDDRYNPTWATGSEWAAFSDTFTVPLVDLMGNPFSAPIAQIDVTLSCETEAAAVGVDELSLIPEPVTIGLLGLGGLFLRRRKK